MKCTRLLLTLLLFGFCGTYYSLSAASPISTEEIILQMTSEELIGQVFLLDFYKTPEAGGWYGPPTLEELVEQYKVGGVILMAANENFYNTNDASNPTPMQVLSLTRKLQELACKANVPSKGLAKNKFLPLLIAIDHEGDGWPYTKLRNGLTQLPSNMAINATWNETHAEKVGTIVGEEMKALGINVLLGPVADVLDRPHPKNGGDMGVRIMGSDPEWVGNLARAYVRGVHDGSKEDRTWRVATVVKHFPGHGRSDRLPDEEIAVINESIDGLRSFDLIPFARTTKTSKDDPLGVTDGLLTSHITYGVGKKQTDPPVSLDPDELSRLLNLPEFSSWHQKENGVIVSDSLGVKALKNRLNVSYKKVARDALMAGNDLLIIADWNNYRKVKEVIEFFRLEYGNNDNFKNRIKEAARKVIALKLKLYPELVLDQPDPKTVTAKLNRKENNDAIRAIAKDAVTLIHPKDKLNLPPLPSKSDRIVIITNAKKGRDCEASNNDGCKRFDILPKDAIQDQIIELYGPNGSGEIDPNLITSWTFEELQRLLEANTNDRSLRKFKDELSKAQYIILALIDWLPRKQWDRAINNFLKRTDFRQSGSIVTAIAYGAPYYLDSTEISKLSAYYAVYSKIDPFIEISVKAFFRKDVTPSGSSPVDIIGYYKVEDYVRKMGDKQPPRPPRGSSRAVPIVAIVIGSATLGAMIIIIRRKRKSADLARTAPQRVLPQEKSPPAPREDSFTPVTKRTMRTTTRDKVFVSYSHEDKKLFLEFKTMLAPAIQRGVVDIWDDTKIRPGAEWKPDIEKALSSAKVGVLLVSGNLLASRFIIQNELPPLLKAAQDGGATIFWVCLSSCLYQQTEIEKFQAAHDVSKPLDQLKKPQRKAVWTEICNKLLEIAENPCSGR